MDDQFFYSYYDLWVIGRHMGTQIKYQIIYKFNDIQVVAQIITLDHFHILKTNFSKL